VAKAKRNASANHIGDTKVAPESLRIAAKEH